MTKRKKNQTQQLFEVLVATYPVIGVLIQFLSDCYHVFDTADPAALAAFIQQYKGCEIGPLVTYVTGLGKDFEAGAVHICGGALTQSRQHFGHPA